MNVNILVIAHDDVGSALVNAARHALGQLPLNTQVVTVSYNTNIDTVFQQLERSTQQLPTNQELLILTDLYGSTPSNLAVKLQSERVKVVSGLNLPMLIRVMNYPQLTLNELADKATSGGKDGVIQL